MTLPTKLSEQIAHVFPHGSQREVLQTVASRVELLESRIKTLTHQLSMAVDKLNTLQQPAKVEQPVVVESKAAVKK